MSAILQFKKTFYLINLKIGAVLFLFLLCDCGHHHDLDDKTKSLILSANRGYAPAQLNLALMYTRGQGVEKNPREAVRLLKLAVEQGYEPAMNNLAVLYELGDGVEKDEKEAAKLYRLLAERGNVVAQCNLALMYSMGRGVEKNEKEAARFYELAANQGEPVAQFTLGLMYASGRGVEKNEKEAVRFYELAADQGEAQAQFTLSLMYAHGRGVEKDVTKAIRLYRISTNQITSENEKSATQEKDALRLFDLAQNRGDAEAQYELALMYRDGSGVVRDNERFMHLLALAAFQGHLKAKHFLDSNPSDISSSARIKDF